MEKNLKNIKQEFKKHGIFYTTSQLAETLKKYVDFEPAAIYDPTCGQGNLLEVFDDNVKKYGQELYSDELEKAKLKLKNFVGYCGDTLKDDGFKDLLFDLIVANPPFSVKWEPNSEDIRFKNAPCVPTASKADYAFMLHILHHLSDKGKAICLEFPGVLYRGAREGEIRKWMIEQNLIERVVHIPGNTFVDTSIATCIIVFNKNKQTTDIVFEDRELEQERVVSIKEVLENDCNLSISTYIFKAIEKEEINPKELEIHARQAFLDRLQKELDFEQVICELEGIEIAPFIKAIEHVLKKYKPNKKAEIAGQMNISDIMESMEEEDDGERNREDD